MRICTPRLGPPGSHRTCLLRSPWGATRAQHTLPANRPHSSPSARHAAIAVQACATVRKTISRYRQRRMTLGVCTLCFHRVCVTVMTPGMFHPYLALQEGGGCPWFFVHFDQVHVCGRVFASCFEFSSSRPLLFACALFPFFRPVQRFPHRFFRVQPCSFGDLISQSAH